MKTSNVYRFNGADPFDNWTIKDNCLYGYYPRNSIINGLSSLNNVIIQKDVLIIPDGVIEIKGSCFRNNKRFKKIIIPTSVRKIGRNAFKGCKAEIEWAI